MLKQKLPEFAGGFTFVSGCFDLLHLGHLKLLNYATSFGKPVIVGLNTLNSVKKLKGFEPILSYTMRAELLENLKAVSVVIPLRAEDARELVRQLKPKIWVLGSDHVKEDFGEFKDIRICFLKRDNNSSTNIKKYLREKLCGNG